MNIIEFSELGIDSETLKEYYKEVKDMCPAFTIEPLIKQCTKIRDAHNITDHQALMLFNELKNIAMKE